MWRAAWCTPVGISEHFQVHLLNLVHRPFSVSLREILFMYLFFGGGLLFLRSCLNRAALFFAPLNKLIHHTPVLLSPHLMLLTFAESFKLSAGMQLNLDVMKRRSGSQTF